MAAFVSRLLGFSPRRVAPPRVASDEVVPLHPFDHIKTLREYTLIWTFRFDDVLDADKLGQSLSQLFQMEGWRKLGGRLRERPDGKLEVHIPTPFTEERPPVLFSKERHDMRMCDHPEARKLPEASVEPATFPGPRDYASLALGPDAPRTFDDFLYSDHPQYSLHVINFKDGTLVSINFSHVTSDLGGLVAILNAWKLVLAGKPEAVPPFMGLTEDPMAPLYNNKPKEQMVLDLPHLSGFSLVRWALGHMWETRQNPLKSRTLCIPRKVMEALLQEARDQIKSVEPDSQGKKPFVSEHDVIVALANRQLAASYPTGSQRNITTLVATDPRARVKSVFREDAAYVQNAALAVFVQNSASDALSMPYGMLALKSREAIQSQSTEEQLKALCWLARSNVAKHGAPPMFGDVGMDFFVISNWSKAAFLDKVDFSPAIVQQAETERPGRKPGHPVYYHSQGLDLGSLVSSLACVMGRDLDGNLWLFGDFSTKVWEAFLDELRKYM